VDIFIQEQFQFHRLPLLSCGMGLNLALPVFDVARVFQIRIDLSLVVKIISQGGMDLGRSQVAKALEDLVDAHAELIISGDAVDGDPRPRDERPSPGDAGIRRDIGGSSRTFL